MTAATHCPDRIETGQHMLYVESDPGSRRLDAVMCCKSCDLRIPAPGQGLWLSRRWLRKVRSSPYLR